MSLICVAAYVLTFVTSPAYGRREKSEEESKEGGEEKGRRGKEGYIYLRTRGLLSKLNPSSTTSKRGQRTRQSSQEGRRS